METGEVRIGVDVGGTFTDVVLLAGETLTTAKVSTTDDQSVGVIEGIETACDHAGVDPDNVDEFRHAMTVATNALLEETGATTALVTTAGFEDVLEIGRQDRPNLYDPSVRGPDPLVPSERRYGVEERATPEGVERAVDTDEIRALAERLDDDIEAVAVSLLHAYAVPDTEKQVAATLRAELDATVVASHETLPTFREYERTATTVAEAFVTPLIGRYLGRLSDRASERGLPEPRVMQSNGGITDVSVLRDGAVETALSGPAAGVVGAALFEDDHEGVISFDMGGTSSDVGLVRDGEVERTTTASVGGHPVHVPMVDIETVGAGGGSITWVDAGGALRVGPESAGAQPGPVCYGRGGTRPTVTDANLVAGYLGAELGNSLELDAEAAHDALSDLAAEADLDDATAAARGVIDVANERMARAIRTVTVERGHDPREFALVAFGGAGPMHAASLADSLDIDTILVPRANGVLSALGLLTADERHDAVQTHRALLSTLATETVMRRYDTLSERVLEDLTTPDRARISREAALRYRGQSHELTVAAPDPFERGAVAERFHAAHERERGYRLDDPVELVTLRVTATVPGRDPTLSHEGTTSDPVEHREAYFDGAFRDTPVYDRDRLPVGAEFVGPVVFEGGESTVVVPPAWRVDVDDQGTLRVEVDR
ncbi:hydantoinase/oxoprolinase family protein [Halovenus marina]|uniref:hydantoinase/oxoprolinase family protein n=1 Tax=Halovenus marina TaxID=3396621 RepID=UPI003F555FCD